MKQSPCLEWTCTMKDGSCEFRSNITDHQLIPSFSRFGFTHTQCVCVCVCLHVSLSVTLWSSLASFLFSCNGFWVCHYVLALLTRLIFSSGLKLNICNITESSWIGKDSCSSPIYIPDCLCSWLYYPCLSFSGEYLIDNWSMWSWSSV